MVGTKTLILQLVRKRGTVTTAEVMQKTGISRQAAHSHLQDLIQKRLIVKQGASRATAYYILNDEKVRRKLCGKERLYKKRVETKRASEDVIFREIESQVGFFTGLSMQDTDNLRYAFTEMVNNAIDHSQSKFIDVTVKIDNKRASFSITDKGIGIYRNLREKRKLVSDMDAIQDLLKGKMTTMPERHSGEGIFFTSKLADRFVIDSQKKRVIVDNRMPDVFVEDRRFLKGTTVIFEMDLPSRRKLIDIFKEYAGENFSFDKSRVKVKLYDTGESYFSRSQAKRLLHSMESFKEIVLDFSDIQTIGQGFADEIFRVFPSQYSEVRIFWENAHENVEFMIKRAKNF